MRDSISPRKGTRWESIGLTGSICLSGNKGTISERPYSTIHGFCRTTGFATWSSLPVSGLWTWWNTERIPAYTGSVRQTWSANSSTMDVTRCFEGLTEYKATKQADQLIERFKCNAVKMSLKMDNSKLICKYLAPPYADVQVVLSGNGFTLYPICWYQDADAETKARILSYINKKLTKYGRTLPFQKKLTYEPKN